MSDTETISAKLTMKLRASTGYEADCTATISPAQWGDINAIAHGKPTAREEQVDAENAALHQDLSDARTGWEQATEAVREAEEVLAKERALREQLVEALRLAEVVSRIGIFNAAKADLLTRSEDARHAALAAAEAA